MNILRNGQLDIEANGYITGKRCGAFAYLQSPESTVITTPGDFYGIKGVFVNSPINDFEVVVGVDATIRYLGTKKQYFLVHGQGSAASDKATNTISVGSKVNGVLQEPGLMCTLIKNVNELYSIGAFLVVELERGDELQIVCCASVAGTTLSFERVTLLVTDFFD